MAEFRFEGWGLFEAIDALMAYDSGSIDSGVSDQDLRQAVIDYLSGLDDHSRRVTCGRFARRLLSDDSLERGYGIEDVLQFDEWVSRVIIEI